MRFLMRFPEIHSKGISNRKPQLHQMVNTNTEAKQSHTEGVSLEGKHASRDGGYGLVISLCFTSSA
eukprot:984564-Amphidinium_carterae.1